MPGGSSTTRPSSPCCARTVSAIAAASTPPAARSGGTRLGGQDQHLLPVLLDRERGDVAGADLGERLLDGPLQVLRPDVAAVDDDQVLGPAGDRQRAVQQVAEVAGVEPALGRQHRGGVRRPAVVAAHQAGAAHQHPADPPVRQAAPGSTRAAQIRSRAPAAAGRTAPRPGATAVRIAGRRRDILLLQPVEVDRVGLDAPPDRREADGQRRLRHAVAGQERARAESRRGRRQRRSRSAPRGRIMSPPMPAMRQQDRSSSGIAARRCAAGAEVVAEARAVGDGGRRCEISDSHSSGRRAKSAVASSRRVICPAIGLSRKPTSPMSW